VIKGVFFPNFDRDQQKRLVTMVYGILCFSILFSFTGTILGGIWADQSWGRFWGWDPKENGALMIVLWVAAILHARWAGMIHDRGLIVMAILGNIVTSFSWFGVNMLGVGLHSYGFMEQMFVGLVAFVFIQLAFAWVGLLPLQYWKGLMSRE
jgi:cytochrome c biogenesis factor